MNKSAFVASFPSLTFFYTSASVCRHRRIVDAIVCVMILLAGAGLLRETYRALTSEEILVQFRIADLLAMRKSEAPLWKESAHSLIGARRPL